MLQNGGTVGQNQIGTELAEGFNAGHGYWNGPAGIVSSAAATDSTFLTTLNMALNNSGRPFDGLPSNIGDILVKHTYYGDTTLDGKVDGSDYSVIDSNFVTAATGWVAGDLNYDGVINGSDYTLIDNTFNRQEARFASRIAITPAAMNKPGDFISSNSSARLQKNATDSKPATTPGWLDDLDDYTGRHRHSRS